ncbi:hypothetical protein AMTRI_Chr10g3210 [Amborella trichopoda]
MGKSGGKKKKAAAATLASAVGTGSGGNGGETINNGLDTESTIFLKRAHELKEEGNRRFQSKDYMGALEQYEQALKLTPKSHPDRAVFHSNRAACLMQMKPVRYDAVVAECSLALESQPGFPRALLRRARAHEALGRLDLAMRDVQMLLQADPCNGDAIELARRLRVPLVHDPAQQDLQQRPLVASSSYAGTSPAALGASAVGGAPIAGLGPCLPARPKKLSKAPPPSPLEEPLSSLRGHPVLKQTPKMVSPSTPSETVLTPTKPANLKPAAYRTVNMGKEERDLNLKLSVRWRPLKLVYDHDIRLAQMPASCGYKVLREIVRKKFPCSKSVLMKYRDSEGDLVTITGTEELRLAELCADLLKKKDVVDGSIEGEVLEESLGVLRLHVVEVSPKQEPLVEDEEEEGPLAMVGEETGSAIDIDSVVEEKKQKEEGEAERKEKGEDEVMEMDDWLFEFAQLFRSHVGIDPDAHVDLHELGMELCSEALEETVTSEEAQGLFEMAAAKFQEVAALAFFNWGNVHMCAARKRIPLDAEDPSSKQEEILRVAYDWVQDRYSQAGQKYEEALRIKPDFYEGLLALGQQHFETAKLGWSYALACKMDLSNWDSEETIRLFDSAEEKMRAATEMWEKLEEQQKNNNDPRVSASKKEEMLKRRKKVIASGNSSNSTEGNGELSAESMAEQALVMRSQIHLFWGNMLFERSQIECKLGMADKWKNNLDAALERFKLAGASETDIAVVLKNHSSNVGVSSDEKKITEEVSVEAGFPESNGTSEDKL